MSVEVVIYTLYMFALSFLKFVCREVFHKRFFVLLPKYKPNYIFYSKCNTTNYYRLAAFFFLARGRCWQPLQKKKKIYLVFLFKVVLAL